MAIRIIIVSKLLQKLKLYKNFIITSLSNFSNERDFILDSNDKNTNIIILILLL